MTIKTIKIHNNPQFAIVTPLRDKDSISNKTLESIISKTNTPFIWISSKSKRNVVQNFQEGFNYLKNINNLPDYIIKIDNDTLWTYGTLDDLYTGLKNSEDNIAYTYCSFDYYGYINILFPAIPFDYERLKTGNYISSNSMFKSKILEKIPMIEDNKYKRLLDWVYYLHLANNGYIGKSISGFFRAKTDKNSISAGGSKDYQLKYKRVFNDFIKGN